MKYPVFIVVLLMSFLGFGACSSSIEEDEARKPVLADGGYLKLAIHLPMGMGMRATQDDSVSDGDSKEYTVYNAKVLLYNGTEERKAKFNSAYEFDNIQLNAVNGTDTKGQISALVSVGKDMSTKIDDNIYVLVILNDHNSIKIATDNQNATITIPGQPEFVFKGTTLANLEKNYCTGTVDGVIGNGGLLMINAPLSTSPGGSTMPNKNNSRIILPNVTKCFYSTLSQAKSHPAADVFVERCMAKVTVSKKEGLVTDNNIVLAESNKTLKWKVLGWKLDLTNKKTYVVRNIQNIEKWIELGTNDPQVSNPYRFVGSVPVKEVKDKEQEQPLYRIYWGESPNSKTYQKEDFDTIATNEIIPQDNMGDDKPQYCFENTNGVSNMKLNQLTRVVLKVQVGDGQDLYTIHSDKSKVYTKDLLNAHIKGHIAESEWAIDAWLNKAYPNGDMPHALPTADDVEFEWRSVNDYSYPYSGGIKVMKLRYVDKTNKKDSIVFNCPNDDPRYINKLLNLGQILIYKGGVSYFGVPIKHFGDVLTPWRAGETPSVSGKEVYPTQNVNANYLGRYGVLRNNWYNIDVTNVTQMGSPLNPPEKPNEFADSFKEYIKVNTQVRSWRRRDQGAVF